MSEANESPTTKDAWRATILVVDDNPTNLSVVSEHLKEQRYRVVVARDGLSGIERAAYAKPDLILLDVMMPRMDGYETCRQLKQREDLRDIPVIFMTALSEISDKIKAFQAGGVDYVTKPFQQEELLARVHTHLQLYRQQADLELKNRQLVEMEKMRDDLVHMIIHDLKTPIWGINAYSEMIRATEIGLSRQSAEMMDHITGTSARLLEMVGSILDVSKMEAGRMALAIAPCRAEKLVRFVYDKVSPLAGKRALLFERAASCADDEFEADEGLLTRVVENLVSNAVKFSPDDGEIRIVADVDAERARISISDTGYGIPEESRDTVFEKFGQVADRQNMKKYSTGLGLPFCRMAVEAHGGRIWLDTQPGETGSRFVFEIPRNPTKPEGTAADGGAASTGKEPQ
jgi:two-component system, sensor histidine kinase and response regulator